MKIEEIVANKDKYTALLKSALSETVENLFFCEPDFDEVVVPTSGEHMFVEILLPIKAQLYGSVSMALASEIASQVLSIETEHLSTVILDDAVGELLNMVAGGFLRGMLPDGETFNLGLPGKMQATDLAKREFLHVSARVNDEPIYFCLVLNSEETSYSTE